MAERRRMLYVDNLRLAMIVLVVLVHCSVTYSGVGSWYFKDPVAKGPVSLLAFILFQAFCQSFFMGLLFFLAGYYARASLVRKGPREFILGRLGRLGLPSLFYMVVINPFIVHTLADMDGVRAGYTLPEFWLGYMKGLYVLGGSGPMWFALALIVFCAAYAALRAIRPSAAQAPARAFRPGLAVGLALICAAGTFLVRLRWPMGTAVLNMQLCFFTQYILLFALGLAAHKNDWLRTLDERLGRWCLLVAAAGIPVLAVAVWDSLKPGGLESYFGGFTWRSLFLSTWESVSGVCMTVGLVAVLRGRWEKTGSLLKWLADSAFAVYVFHSPLVVGLGRLLEPVQAPALAKFLLLGGLALPLSFGLAWVIRRTPLLRELVKA
ncbi:acyltransferase family protein [Desulfovibrio aminophilus]|nr:acyltransferase family protein [Desulfovibrio aminophilus]MCM0754980.1 acyltransferase family protein [Desulfovibrio aminophilus]